ncbi:MAG: histidine phosphotransferase family protein, partial [Pseudomonadota bacterium]
ASRICHDLVSPVGAIGNGVELMQELGEDAGDEAVSLISSSAAQAAIRLKCFRLAYGAAGTDKNIGFREVREVFTDWLKSGHVQVEFEPDLELRFSMPPRGFLKCVLNLLIFAEECSRGEGRIFVSAPEEGKGVKILATGRHVGFREDAGNALSGETAPEALDARTVHAYMTGKFAGHFGFKIAHQEQPDFGRLELRISF